MAVIKGFRAFVLRGNVIDLATGIVVGAAFNSVVQGFVTAFVNPLIQLFGAPAKYGALAFQVRGVSFPYGQFVNSAVSFVIVCAVVYFFVVTPYHELQVRFMPSPQPAPTRECPFCLSKVPQRARKCMYCTSELAPST
jgi:large conductance mechanosensitive channel